MHAKSREHAAKNRAHAADILQGTWPTTVEQRTTGNNVFNLASTSNLFQRMVSKLAYKYDGLVYEALHFKYIHTFQHFDLVTFAGRL